MATPTRFPQDKIERLAKFGTVVESCSKKVAVSAVLAFADTLDGEGGASASPTAKFIPLFLTTLKNSKQATFSKNCVNFLSCFHNSI